MKEHPILFSRPMVRALLNTKVGSWPAEAIDPSKAFKWQTRRIVKPQPDSCQVTTACANAALLKNAPHQVGDRLWGRETFAEPFHRSSDPDCEKPLYAADDDVCLQRQAYFVATGKPLRFTPSIFMPRVFSRITLEVMEVRVQRVQEIDEEDAIAEGITLVDGHYNPRDFTGCWADYSGSRPYWNSPRDSFHSLWDSINIKKHPWRNNPWVWCYSLRRVK